MEISVILNKKTLVSFQIVSVWIKTALSTFGIIKVARWYVGRVRGMGHKWHLVIGLKWLNRIAVSVGALPCWINQYLFPQSSSRSRGSFSSRDLTVWPNETLLWRVGVFPVSHRTSRFMTFIDFEQEVWSSVHSSI